MLRISCHICALLLKGKCCKALHVPLQNALHQRRQTLQRSQHLPRSTQCTLRWTSVGKGISSSYVLLKWSNSQSIGQSINQSVNQSVSQHSINTQVDGKQSAGHDSSPNSQGPGFRASPQPGAPTHQAPHTRWLASRRKHRERSCGSEFARDWRCPARRPWC